MPWKETYPMDQRVAFIADWLRDEWTMTELAERYQISRKTCYKWVDRYDADPAHGLAERSRAPHVHGRAMSAAIREAVLAVRQIRGDNAVPPGKTVDAHIVANGHPVFAREAATIGRLARATVHVAASAFALCRPVDHAAGGGDSAERSVDDGFQGLVPDDGWHAMRSADGGGRM